MSFPIVILYYLRKEVRHGDNLQYCTMKYKYGFYYLGFKKNYYYWEFVRIFFKIIIVVFIALLSEEGTMVYVTCIIFIFLYILSI